MSGIYGPLATQIASLVSSSVIENYCTVASTALVLYDHICTIPQEMQLIWGSKVTSTMVLFHANRWLILAYAITNIVQAFSHPGSIVSCAVLYYTVTVVELCLFTLWAAFSGIRVYALSGGSLLLSLAIALLSLVPVGTNAYFDFYGSTSQLLTFPVLGSECLERMNISETTDTRFSIGTRMPVIVAMIADVIVLLIAVRKTWTARQMVHEHGIDMPLGTLLLRDGTLHFACLLSLNLFKVIGQTTDVAAFYGFSSFLTPLSSIIITHFILNLRQLVYGSHDEHSYTSVAQQGAGQTSGLRFGCFVGNMGQSLDHGSELDDADLGWDGDDAQDDMEHPRTSADVISDLLNVPASPPGDVEETGGPTYDVLDIDSLAV